MENRLTEDREAGVALAALVALLAITAGWWALAFWPVHESPAWLARTRYVCFGVAESGLPDAGGWVGLVGGPLGMLGIVLVGWWRGVRQLVRMVRTSNAAAGTFLLLATACIFMFTGAALQVRRGLDALAEPEISSTMPPAHYPRLDRPAPELALVGHDGTEKSLTRLRGRPVLVTFAYAHCQTICPVVVRHVLDAQKLLHSREPKPAVLIVTLDPWRDTPSRLQSMADQWQLPKNDAWILSGEVTAVEAALDAWNVPRRRDQNTGDVTHPALVYIIDAAGSIAFASTGGAESLASLVRRL